MVELLGQLLPNPWNLRRPFIILATGQSPIAIGQPRKDGLQRVVIALRDRIELVIVAA